MSFIESMNSFVSASESIVAKSSYLPSVIIEGLGVQDTQIVFKMNNVIEADGISMKNFAIHLKLFFSVFLHRARLVSHLMKVRKLWQQVRPLVIEGFQDENFCIVWRFVGKGLGRKFSTHSTIVNLSASFRLIKFFLWKFLGFDLFRARIYAKRLSFN